MPTDPTFAPSNAIAVIPARGGSKRIRNKNIRRFAGRPMIEWSIETCLASGLFSKVIVSTDNNEIADIARDSGAVVPFVRPADLSDDHATTIDVMAHAAAALQLADEVMLACIYPCTPLLTTEILREAATVFHSSPLNYVFGMSEYPYPIQRALVQDTDGAMRMEMPEHLATRTQDLLPRYHDVGQFYFGRAGTWRARLPIFGSATQGVLIPRSRVCDIDTLDDWKHAELLFNALAQRE